MMGLLLGCGRCRIGLNEACFEGELQSLGVSGSRRRVARKRQTRSLRRREVVGVLVVEAGGVEW